MKLTNNTKKWIRLASDILFSVMLAVCGVLFIHACYSIYTSGPSPFTRESIALAFDKISVPVYVTLSLAVIGFGVHTIFPKEKGKLKGARSPRVMAQRLADRTDISLLPCGASESVLKERKLRQTLGAVRIALIFLSATMPMIFLLNPDNFPAVNGEYNSEILHGMLLYLAFLAPLCIFEVVYVLVCDASFTKEYELLREHSGMAKTVADSHDLPVSLIAKIKGYLKENEKPILLGVRIALVGCAIVFIIAGIHNGGVMDVLNKAINICTECVGLG